MSFKQLHLECHLPLCLGFSVLTHRVLATPSQILHLRLLSSFSVSLSSSSTIGLILVSPSPVQQKCNWNAAKSDSNLISRLQHLNTLKPSDVDFDDLTLYVLNFSEGRKHIFTFHVIPPHWYDTGSWNPSSNKTRTYLFYMVNIMTADVLAMQGARASATMILT